MKFRIRFAHQIVGIFALLAILGIAAILILLGLNQRWFAKNYYFWSTFKSAGGLSAGMPIRLKGFEIGKLSAISLSKDNMVEIEFYVMDSYYIKVLPNSVLELTSNPLGIGGGLLFHPGRGPAEPIPEFSYIPSLDLDAGRKLVARGLVDRSTGEDPVGAILTRVAPILEEIEVTLGSIYEMVDTLTGELKGESTGPLSTVLNDLTRTTEKINGVMDDLKRVVANIEELSEGLTDPTGLARRLLDPKGSLATILDDDNRLYNDLVQAIEQLTGIITQLSELTRFVNSTQPQIVGILEKGKVALDQGQDVLEAVKNNPLLRGGIPAKLDQPTTFQSYRDEDF